MNPKEEALAEILDISRRNNITLDEISDAPPSHIEIPKDLVLETVQAQSYTPQATEHTKNTSDQIIGF